MSHMTHILAIDTSTDACSVGLYSAPDQVQETFDICPAQHTAKILPQINQLLNSANISLSEVDALAFGQGPGSFTGVRIAVCVAQALGFGLHKPLIPVSTLRAIAQAAFIKQGHRQVVAMLDARLGAVYWGLYRLNADKIMEAIQPDQVGPQSAIVVPDSAWVSVMAQYPHALDMARIGAYEYTKGNCVAATEAVPVYVRDKVV
jgi:tRNA threonylcarbamoyladenosine biosynthesis protein TsaB